MASTDKKKGKKKGQTISLNAFLADENESESGKTVLIASGSNWGDIVEDEDVNDSSDYTYGGPAEKVVLPTAPRAARGPNIDMSRVPTEPPFTAYVGNLPYDIDEEQIAEFFAKLGVLNVRLPSDGGRLRGFGYAEFPDREMLIEALAMNDEMLRGRKIRVDLASGSQKADDDRRGGGGYGNRDRRDQDRGGDPDRTEGDWRRGPPGGGGGFDDRDSGYGRSGGYGSRDDRPGDRYSDRYGDRGGDRYGGDRYGDRGGDRYGGDRYGDRGGDRYGDRGGDRYGDRGGDRYGDRYGDRNGDYGHRSGGYGDRERGGGGYGGRDGYGDRDRGYGGGREGGRGFSNYNRDERGGGYGGGPRSRDGYSDSRYQRDDREPERDSADAPPGDRPRMKLQPRSAPLPSEERAPAAEEAPAERKRLVLQPRTKPVEAEEKPAQQSSSIFGGAKPVNTAAKEREIEERLQKQHELAKPAEEEQRRDRHEERRSSHDGGHRRRDSENSDSGRDGREYREYKRRERKLSSGSSSSKGGPRPGMPRSQGPPRARQDRGSREGSESDRHDQEVTEESKPVQSPQSPTKKEEVKVSPAPPPSVNIWEKRKQASQGEPPAQGPSQQSPPSADDRQAAPPRRVEANESYADRSKATASESKPAAGPPPNAWSAGRPAMNDTKRQQNGPQNQQYKKEGEERGFGGSHWGQRRGDSAERGRGRGYSDRGRGGPRGRGRGTRERPMPRSIDEMPKFEEKTQRDFSDGNVFSALDIDEVEP
ncbi:eukaryotic translation initiation factor 4B [Lingula anatina]|uniref:Eukaryotic translation initiation factor 4B n=1 Tax=Lingula anatina TaxID=7574 RepID=A0A1S3H729_LINAN|nr:eukaryotic translation initiation factor 4B [Lingula anatina]|eukprot:XP_013381286.1 eukaryotic translation initiation factor 4B [Lingula anatina]